jgi:hypothetical protein
LAALYDSASLLDLFNEKAGRPPADAVTVARKYRQLTQSQNRIVAKIAAIAPSALYPRVSYDDLPQLETVDNQVFTFGEDDNDYPIFPIGKGGIYTSLSNIPDMPWREGVDFLNEGTQIRIPNNRTYTGSLYWYGIANPGNIDEAHEPVLFPEAARELIVIDAVRQFAANYARQPNLVAMMAAEWSDAWPTWCLTFKTQFRSGGALRCWTGRQLALRNHS